MKVTSKLILIAKDGWAKALLNVPGYSMHWIPEHLEAALAHYKTVIAEVQAEARLDEAKWWCHVVNKNKPCDWVVLGDERIAALEQAAHEGVASRAEEKEIEDRYASYANHCAIQKKVPLSFHSWRKL